MFIGRVNFVDRESPVTSFFAKPRGGRDHPATELLSGENSRAFSWGTLLVTIFCLAKADTSQMSPPAVLQQLRDFNNLGSVLHIGAHPDDENTQLITYLARGRGYRTAYLSLTRGDGGQNELGPEFGEKLGVARTQELLAARRLDGGQQFFTRAIDFGFSKNPEETLRIWNRAEILSDVVRVIRTFRPDVIITRFPIPPGSGGHGHHTASAILAVEAFKLAGDAQAYPEQLKEGLTPWQAKRIVWNGWNPGRGTAPGPSVKVDISGNDPVTGESFAAIAARSRAMHITQGFGNFATRAAALGPHEETFILFGGETAQKDFMDGVETTWSRYPKGAEIDAMTQKAIAEFKADDLAASVPALLAIRTKLNVLSAPYIKRVRVARDDLASDPLLHDKAQQLDRVLQACLGLEVRTTLPVAEIVPGERLHLHFKVIEHSAVPLRWTTTETPSGQLKRKSSALTFNQIETADYKEGDQRDRLPLTTAVSQPYWLREEGEVGTFHVDDPTLIGRPENPPVWPVKYHFRLPNGEDLVVNDEPVQIVPNVSAAQVQRLLTVIPPVSLRFVSHVSVFTPGSSRTVALEVTAARENQSGALQIDLPKGWKVTPASQAFQLHGVGESARFNFRVSSPAGTSTGLIAVSAKIGEKDYSNQRVEINYKHLPLLLLQPPATARLASFPFAIRGKRVGYLSGAGDDTVEALQQLGYEVVTLTDADLKTEKLRGLDAVVLGVRAFNVRHDLAANLPGLFAYIEAGGTVVEQYNRPNGLKTDQLGPYALSLAGDAPALRVTDENAPVSLLVPADPALTKPNLIGPEDFKDWVQERGAYFPSSWDLQHYTALLAMNDPGEAPLKSSVLVARYGRGYFVYTSLAFFRQLPAGNPGAYRLFANLLSLGKE